MTILQRYIARTIIFYTLLTVLVVLGLDFFIGLLTELRDIGSGDYGFWQAVQHTFFRIPYSVYQFSPMLILLGGMLGLGLLASQQELMIMRSSGVSVFQLLKAVLIAAVILVLIATLFGELLAPRANYLANKQKDSAQNGGQAVATVSGVWVHEGNNFLHIERVLGLHRLEGVTRYEFNDQHKLLTASYAKSLEFQDQHWVLQDLVETTFQEDKTISRHDATGTWDLKLNPNLLNVGLIEPQEMTLPHLLKYSRHMVKNGLQASRFQFEFWKRVFQPLGTLVMMLLALPFVLRTASRSGSMGLRMLFGVVVGFAFYILNAFLGQLSVVYQLSPFWVAALPMGVFAVVGWGLVRRVV